MTARVVSIYVAHFSYLQTQPSSLEELMAKSAGYLVSGFGWRPFRTPVYMGRGERWDETNVLMSIF
jgi:hypothetical protein